MEDYERKWRGCINDWKQDPNGFRSFDHSAIWGEHPGVYIIVYEHDVHLKNYKL